MFQKNIFTIVVLLLVIIVIQGCRDSESPDILLILADDMGYSDLGVMGSEIATPNIDKLAGSGLLFLDFYNGARCCPTRASLITGLYDAQTDQRLPAAATGVDFVELGEITIQ